jgi:hypothetical protein
MELEMKMQLNKDAKDTRYDRAPIYASSWMALFFDLRQEFRLARNPR